MAILKRQAPTASGAAAPQLSRWHRANRRDVLAALAVLATALGSSVAQPGPDPIPTLTTAQSVRNLPPDLATHAKAHLVGTVSYYDRDEHNLFFQDATGGVYIETSRPLPLAYGDLISVTGPTAPSYRTELALDPTIQVIGKGHLTAPRPVTYTQLATGNLDSQYVTLRGVVRAMDVEQHENAPILHLDVQMPGGAIEVYQPATLMTTSALPALSNSGQSPLLDAEVEITGIAGGAFDTKSQLTGIIVYVQNASGIRVLKPATTDPLHLPLTDVDSLFQSLRVQDQSARVRVRGVLTFFRHGDSAVLEQPDGKSVLVETRETAPIPIGTVVDAIGFASDQQYAPSLRQAELFSTGKHGNILPREINFTEALSGLFSDNLIAMKGVLLSQVHGNAVETVVINVDDRPVMGRLYHTGKLPDLRVGTQVRLVGVCNIIPGGPYRAPAFFNIDMRSPADLETISAPSWFTVKHLLASLGALSFLVLAVAGWAMLLRRRVKQQTERIERSMLIAKRRGALVETVSADQSLPQIISLLCQCTAEFLPGILCTWHEFAENCDPLDSPPSPPVLVSGWNTLREVDLPAVGEARAGRLVFQGPATASPAVAADRAEVIAMITEVAQLAFDHAQLYESLIHHSTHDPLTDLPNRRLCEQRLRHALKQAECNGSRVAVLYVDVNRFKQVNDRFGHKIGDLYLRSISTRLREKLRPADTLARIGGDEFLVIVPHVRDPEDAQCLLERLQACFDQPFLFENRQYLGSASFGVACFPDHGTTAEDLKRFADHAMYLRKRTSATIPSPADESDFNIVTPDEIKAGLARGDFRLAYQPQFSADGRLVGLEALLRLQDPILGTLSPDAFIAVAERSVVIAPLGHWVLRTAIEDAVRWGLHRGPLVLLIVNVAPSQIVELDFADTLASLLKETGFPAHRLELELTEQTIANSPAALQQLQQLRALGVRVSLEHFGSGHSSLRALHRLPLDTIKMDRAFVSAIEAEPAVLPVLQAISSMAAALHIRVVAEGIETAGAIPVLRRLGPMDLQGFFFSRPVLASRMPEHLGQWLRGLDLPTSSIPEIPTTSTRSL